MIVNKNSVWIAGMKAPPMEFRELAAVPLAEGATISDYVAASSGRTASTRSAWLS